jgi:hypothetical protein
MLVSKSVAGEPSGGKERATKPAAKGLVWDEIPAGSFERTNEKKSPVCNVGVRFFVGSTRLVQKFSRLGCQCCRKFCIFDSGNDSTASFCSRNFC